MPPSEIVIPEGADVARARTCMVISIVSDIALLAVLDLSCMFIVSGGYNPFIYFQF